MIFPDVSCKRIVIALVTLSVAVILVISLYKWCDQGEKHAEAEEIRIFTGTYSRAAAIANAPPCASIAKDVLLEGGKAVDAMIAAMFCDGVTMPQYMGLGGGFFMTIYKKSKGEIHTINAREMAPGASSPNMFHNDPKASERGPLSIAVPGEVKGYWTAYQKFGGGVPWKRLIEPTIKLAENGIPICKVLYKALVAYEETVKTNPEFRNLFTDPETRDLLDMGQTYKNEKLAKTLRIIADEGADAFYTGAIGKALVKDVQAMHGIMTEEDLEKYEVQTDEAIKARIFNNLTLYTSPAPASGVLLSYILRILDGKLPAPSETLNVHRITEALKYGYGVRSKLGDSNFVDNSKIIDAITSEDYITSIRNQIVDNKTWNDPQHYGGDSTEPRDKGTGNLAVVAENGDVVVATSTINFKFGSLLFSESTGILLNDEMDDFSTTDSVNVYGIPPSKANAVEPYKRPLSSSVPSIILDKNNNVRLAIGAAGGSKITSSVALATINNLVFNETLEHSIDNVLFHHQLIPMLWQYYQKMPKHIVDDMIKIGHKAKASAATSFAVVSGIEIRDGKLLAVIDKNRPGQVDGY